MTLISVAVVCALVVGFIIGWARTQRATFTTREKLAAATAQFESAKSRLTEVDTQLSDLRKLTTEQEARVSRAESERDAALARALAAEGRLGQIETTNKTAQESIARIEKDLAEKNAVIKINDAHLNKAASELKERADEIATLRGQVRVLEDERAGLREKNGALQQINARNGELLNTQKQWIEEQTKNLQALFAKTAGELLEDKATKFTQSNQDQIKALMAPFQSQLADFRKRVDEVHGADTSARAKLEQQITSLASKASEINTTAENLASAMLGNTKKQGNWGETQLIVLLEQAGFVKGKHFDTQVLVHSDAESALDGDEDNARRFPDTVLWLPESECLVIDSKLSLPSWTDYCSSDDPDVRKGALAAMVASMRKHYQDLAGVDYARLVSKGKSVPFTLMFVPIEAAGIEAFRASPDLFADAQKKKVIMVTPTTLFCVLQLVHAIWGLHERRTNAVQIADAGRLLLKKVNSFLGSFSAVGQSLSSALESYQAAKGQLLDGKGNLVSMADRMAKLGVETPKGGELARLIESGDQTSDEEATATILSIEEKRSA